MKSYEKFEPIIAANSQTIIEFIEKKGFQTESLTMLFDHFVSQLIPFDEKDVQCTTGCAYCCHLKVTASIPEMLIILGYLRESGKVNHFRNLIKDSPGLYPEGSCNDEQWWVGTTQPCLFLDTNAQLCRIYEARPFTCRGYHSLDKAACEKGYTQKCLTPIPCFPDLKRSREIYSISFERAMHHLGKQSKQVVVSQAAVTLLLNPGLINHWMNGGHIF